MALEDNVAALRKKRGGAVSEQLQGVTEDRIGQVLTRLHPGNNADLVNTDTLI